MISMGWLVFTFYTLAVFTLGLCLAGWLERRRK